MSTKNKKRPAKKKPASPRLVSTELLDVLADELRAEATIAYRRVSNMSGPEELKVVWHMCDALAACIERTRDRTSNAKDETAGRS